MKMKNPFIRYQTIEIPRYTALEDTLSEARVLLSSRLDDGAPGHHNAYVHLQNSIAKAENFIENHGRDVQRAIKKFREEYKQ